MLVSFFLNPQSINTINTEQNYWANIAFHSPLPIDGGQQRLHVTRPAVFVSQAVALKGCWSCHVRSLRVKKVYLDRSGTSKFTKKRTNTVWFHSYEVSKIVKIIAMEGRKGVARAGGRRDGESVSAGYSLSITTWKSSSPLHLTLLNRTPNDGYDGNVNVICFHHFF